MAGPGSSAGADSRRAGARRRIGYRPGRRSPDAPRRRARGVGPGAARARAMNAPLSARGYALVSVLWLVVLLTGITAAYHAQARVEARLLTAGLQRAQAEALAEAGLWIAAYEHFFAAT